MSILHVENVTHSFGDKTIFRELSFRLQNHERVGLIGPNGAGKSTLIRILSGDVLPDNGSIDWLSGIEIGHLQQHIDLHPGQTLLDYLRGAFAELYALEAEMIELTQKMDALVPGTDSTYENALDALLNRFAAIQETLDLHDFYSLEVKIEEVAVDLGLQQLGFETHVDQLSGGQRTKLLLAKLLLQQPQVLLLDEPTNHLDRQGKEALKEALTAYPGTVLLVTHEPEFYEGWVTEIWDVQYWRDRASF